MERRPTPPRRTQENPGTFAPREHDPRRAASEAGVLRAQPPRQSLPAAPRGARPRDHPRRAVSRHLRARRGEAPDHAGVRDVVGDRLLRDGPLLHPERFSHRDDDPPLALGELAPERRPLLRAPELSDLPALLRMPHRALVHLSDEPLAERKHLLRIRLPHQLSPRAPPHGGDDVGVVALRRRALLPRRAAPHVGALRAEIARIAARAPDRALGLRARRSLRDLQVVARSVGRAADLPGALHQDPYPIRHARSGYPPRLSAIPLRGGGEGGARAPRRPNRALARSGRVPLRPHDAAQFLRLLPRAGALVGHAHEPDVRPVPPPSDERRRFPRALALGGVFPPRRDARIRHLPLAHPGLREGDGADRAAPLLRAPLFDERGLDDHARRPPRRLDARRLRDPHPRREARALAPRSRREVKRRFIRRRARTDRGPSPRARGGRSTDRGGARGRGGRDRRALPRRSPPLRHGS